MNYFNPIDFIACVILGFIIYFTGLVLVIKYGLLLHLGIILFLITATWLAIRWHAVVIAYVLKAIRPVQPK